jgi:hypothetical protein
MKLTLLFVLAAAPAFAQLPSTQKTFGSLNGRWWMAESKPQRVTFILGVNELLEYMPDTIDKTIYFAPVTMGEMTDGVDQIYAKTENITMPVIWVIQAFVMKVRGVDPAIVEKQLAEWRRLIIALEASK